MAGEGTVSVKCYRGAKWCKITQGENRERTSCISKIQYESVIQAVSDYNGDEEGEVHFVYAETKASKRMFWMCIAVFEVELWEENNDMEVRRGVERHLYCVTKQCQTDSCGLVSVSRSAHPICVLELKSTVRAAMVMHCCEKYKSDGSIMTNCRIDTGTGEVCHDVSLKDGGVYEVWGRYEGFPPRRG